MKVAEKQTKHLFSEEKLHLIALSMVPQVGGITAKQLISYCGSATQVFTASTRQLARIPGIGSKTVQAIRNTGILDKARQEMEACTRKGIQIITSMDPSYPFRLQQIYDAPLVLYYQGTAPLEHARVLSVVGTRKATPYGIQIVKELIAALSSYHVLVVSGLAYGIDICAHRTALTNGVLTVGVMASGLDIIYPSVHRKEAIAMTRQGGLLTEHPLGCKPDPRKFPARNRLIAGLSDVTVVVEAAERGGALITANLANDYNREVFAVPGSWQQPYSKGCNHLIKDHKAHILTKPEDLVYMMKWDLPTTNAPRPASKATIDIAQLPLDEKERAVVRFLQECEEEVMMDVISWKTQIPIYQLASVLLQLEIKHVVKVYPGKKFRIALDEIPALSN